MKKQTFKAATVNPQNLSVHPLLLETGFNFTPDQYFIDALKDLGLYERPIIMENKVLTHCAEVLAAQANNVTDMDVCIVDMTEMQLRLLISLKHKYHKKDLIKCYHTIMFYEDYLNNNAEGIELAETLKGDINDKIAKLMHTSTATIKRLKRVGDNKYETLGLIQQRELSMKDVINKIKEEEMATNMEMKKGKATANQSPSTIQFPSTENSNHDTAAEDDYYDDTVLEGNEPIVQASNNSTTSSPAIDFEQASFTIGNLGQLDVTVSDNIPQVFINGKPIANLNYQYYVNRDSLENGKSESIVISQSGKKPFMMQVTFENLPKAA